MAEKLRKYFDTVKQDITGQDEEIILHRLYYLTGKYFLDAVDNLSDDEALLHVMRQSFGDISHTEDPNAETNGYSLAETDADSSVQEKAATAFAEKEPRTQTEASAAAVTEKAEAEQSSALAEKKESKAKGDASLIEISLQVKKSKRNFRYQIGGQELLFASRYFHNMLTELLLQDNAAKQKLFSLSAELAYKQMDFFFKDSSQSPAVLIESGLFLFKKMGWGNFDFIVKEVPYLIGLHHSLEGAQTPAQKFLAASFLNGICSYANSRLQAQAFEIKEFSAEQLQDQYGDLSQYELVFYIKGNS